MDKNKTSFLKKELTIARTNYSELLSLHEETVSNERHLEEQI